MRDHHPVFHLQPEAGQNLRRAIHALGKFTVSVAPLIVDERCLGGAARNEVAFDQIVCGVVPARYLDLRRRAAMVGPR
jgi:hypothetical protein